MLTQNHRVNDGSSAFSRPLAIYLLLLLVAIGWLGATMLAPYLVHSKQLSAATFIYRAFSLICHQLSERSLFLFGYPLSVCSRCAGIYAGFLAGLIVYPFIRSLDCASMPHRRYLLLALLPISIDFAGGLLGVFENTTLSRAVTGLLLGATSSFYLLPGLLYAAMEKLAGSPIYIRRNK